jgi:DNA-binding IclR family transcriptional regulator
LKIPKIFSEITLQELRRLINKFQQKSMESNMLEKVRVPALQRTVRIFDLLAEQGKCQANEIIKHLGVPKSSGYLLLDELQKHGLITQDKNGAFSLGMKLITLGDISAAQLDLRDIAHKYLINLMEKTELLCHLGIMDNEAAYYILKIESHSTISIRSHVGKKLSLYSSGIGKCLLAWQPEEMRRKIIESITFIAHTPTTINGPETLEEALAEIRNQGWGFDNGEDLPDVRCVAAPIFDAKNSIVAAISVVGATLQIKDSRIEELSRQVMACSQAISRELGWNSPE